MYRRLLCSCSSSSKLDRFDFTVSMTHHTETEITQFLKILQFFKWCLWTHVHHHFWKSCWCIGGCCVVVLANVSNWILSLPTSLGRTKRPAETSYVEFFLFFERMYTSLTLIQFCVCVCVCMKRKSLDISYFSFQPFLFLSFERFWFST